MSPEGSLNRDMPARAPLLGPTLNLARASGTAAGGKPAASGSNFASSASSNARGATARYHAGAAALVDAEQTLSGAPEETQEIRRLVIACDHRGYDGKVKLLPKLQHFDCEIIDIGCDGERGCDYPDYAAPAARMVAEGEADAAVLLDGSGLGMSIVANKIRGIRAATCHDEITARIAREHNHCNVLCVGTDLISEKAVADVVETFLSTSFSGGRHVRRVAKISALELESIEIEAASQLRASS